ncbi:ferritin-like domain-containing protein [Haloterrigena sp. SYSU A558-1]|uniref:Ferritin-like domain-containing protein n=1 Tax=Haloterrigena gelatinilytica TaxID=2741724 RepID=A0A8J8GRP5_9EURY|nr:DUF892 family protein [Haloterrigena gelatinilytica]NUB92300.1 ferritin-like domain-containing protein [Haloterrigena gelatinilytica]NUC71875.1 ferritin-like domain-containing protein [Haloterrigena gelatinilytica]
MSDRQSEIRDVEALFAYELEAVYDMEVRLVDALDDMSQLATNDNLSKGFAIHRRETERQVENVEAAFAALGREPNRRPNRIVDGLLAEREGIDAGVADDALRNVYYRNAAIRTERLEITSYEGLLELAERGDLGAAVTEPLERNLAQEEKTLRKLEGLADDDSGLKSLWDDVTGS